MPTAWALSIARLVGMPTAQIALMFARAVF